MSGPGQATGHGDSALLRDLSRTVGVHFNPSPILETFTWQDRTSYSMPKPKSNPQPNKQHVHAN